MNIEISARGRGNWNDWKLGDSILVCSVLAHISDSINLYTMYPESKGIKLIEKLSHKIYNDKYELNIMSGNFSLATHIYHKKSKNKPWRITMKNLQVTNAKNLLDLTEKFKEIGTKDYKYRCHYDLIRENMKEGYVHKELVE